MWSAVATVVLLGTMVYLFATMNEREDARKGKQATEYFEQQRAEAEAKDAAEFAQENARISYDTVYAAERCGFSRPGKIFPAAPEPSGCQEFRDSPRGKEAFQKKIEKETQDLERSRNEEAKRKALLDRIQSGTCTREDWKAFWGVEPAPNWKCG
ncbi:hypothetical protein FJW08_20530 [Mesorhizobium sp. B3-2-1]|uniref:hypothetical protein n=1 Tax=Mesorhizobium sp. B3-2-1 TaxID=2589891 RepID=UPI00112B3D88|nr:hypothetical protein [Mesorhizobium sp. B3-2-1]TPI28465.1 hypothetical protein FJW08_20530 [Mesorhizobium sp. B3-2-1]